MDLNKVKNSKIVSQLAVRGIPKPWGIQSTSPAVQKGYVCMYNFATRSTVYVSTARVVIKVLQSMFGSKLFCFSPFPKTILSYQAQYCYKFMSYRKPFVVCHIKYQHWVEEEVGVQG